MNAFSEIHPLQAPIVHAVLAEANGRGHRTEPAVPDGVLLDAPEQCRVSLQPGDFYAFGFTLLAGSQTEADHRVGALIRGLHSLGDKAARGAKLGGNFRIEVVQDLVSGQALFDGASPEPVSNQRFSSEVAVLANRDTVTLRFTSPLRAARPKSAKETGHAYFDRHYFDCQHLLRRMQARQRSIGFLNSTRGSVNGPQEEADLPEHFAELIENALSWLDVTYGPANDRTSLGGCFGRVRLKVLDKAMLPTLVRGQYVGVGENLRFGFGKFRIEELGPDPTACSRSTSLMELAFRQPAPDLAAAHYELEPGRISEQIRKLNQREYDPDPCQSVWIDQGKRQRLLAIPTRTDRAMQRCVNELLAPAVDKFLESSSLAYRKGLNRERAAERIRKAWQDGYRWALRADFLRFFDSVDHTALRHCMDAYINDDPMVELMMQWVRSGSPEETCGLPTGAVISPMLANMFLDRFDEQVEKDGRCLVRYADDLMLLFKTRDEADQVFRDAEAAAARLSLALNPEKTGVIPLNEPFRFVGFDFRPEQGWRATPSSQPCHLDDLGWEDASNKPDDTIADIRLPGEQPSLMSAESSIMILGPGLRRLDIQNQRLTWQYVSSIQPVHGRQIDQISQLIVLGTPTLSGRFVREVQRNGVNVTLTDRSGRTRSVICGNRHDGRADLIQKQIEFANDPARRLSVCRQLIAAKIRNFAVLAAAVPGRSKDQATAVTLVKLEQRVFEATSVEELLGIEGAAAAAWYEKMNSRIPSRFSFERRVSPKASDPINVLLNIAHTTMYRQAALLIEQAGFAASIGILHRPRDGFMALAADIQEPFRHLMERAVLETAEQIFPGDFTKSHDGPFNLVIKPHATKRLFGVIFRLLTQPVRAADDAEPVDYRLQMARTIRSLRRFLLGASDTFEPFRQPDAEPKNAPAAAGKNLGDQAPS